MLTGCDVTNKDATQSVLRAMSAWNDRVQAFLFSPTRLAREYPASKVMRPPRFNAFYGREMVKDVDPGGVEARARRHDRRQAALGAARHPRAARGDAAHAPRVRRGLGLHRRVDRRGRSSLFLERVGADMTAKYVGFKCIDGYSGSIDIWPPPCIPRRSSPPSMRDVLHKDFGFPIRLRVATKLGFKSPKQIVAMEVTNSYPGGYWENRRYKLVQRNLTFPGLCRRRI
jgi:hypothetical protein